MSATEKLNQRIAERTETERRSRIKSAAKDLAKYLAIKQKQDEVVEVAGACVTALQKRGYKEADVLLKITKTGYKKPEWESFIGKLMSGQIRYITGAQAIATGWKLEEIRPVFWHKSRVNWHLGNDGRLRQAYSWHANGAPISKKVDAHGDLRPVITDDEYLFEPFNVDFTEEELQFVEAGILPPAVRNVRHELDGYDSLAHGTLFALENFAKSRYLTL